MNRRPEDETRRFWLLVAAAIALQAVLTLTSLYGLSDPESYGRWNPLPILVSAALLGLSLWLAAPIRSAHHDADMISELRILTAIVVLALGLRLYALDRIPPGFFQDEAINANEAVALGRSAWKLWSIELGGRPTLFLYLLRLPILVFGNTYLALKIVPVAIGVATVVATYLLGRVLFGRTVGLWAAFLLAAAQWHIHYSRMAWEAICTPLFAAVGFALLSKGLRTKGRSEAWLTAAGAVLALGLYTYAAYRAVPLIAGSYLLLLALSRPAVLRHRWLGLLAATAMFAVVIGPLTQFAVQHPNLFWARQKEVGFGAEVWREHLWPLWDQIGKTLLAFNHHGDRLVRHNLPLAPQLDVVTGTLFLLGLALSLGRRGAVGLGLLWLWFGGFVILAAMTKEAPHATRLLGVLPAVVLFAALGAEYLWRSLRDQLPARLRAWALAALATAIVALNAHSYFVLHANDRGGDLAFNTLARTLCEELRRAPGATVLWTDDIDYWASAQCKFLATETRFALAPLTIDQLLSDMPMRLSRPTIVVFGTLAVQTSSGRITIGASGIPDIALAGAGEVVRDRFGNPMYYLYRLE